MMDLDRFWEVIEAARQAIASSPKDEDDRPTLQDEKALAEALRPHRPDEIIEFQYRFDERMLAAYHWDLWAALWILEGGGGDDTFEHFRAELIMLGRKTFEAALADTESLADLDTLPVGIEGLIYVPAQVYQEKTGQEFPYNTTYEVPKFPEQPVGERWEEEDLPDRHSRLWAKFAEQEEHDGRQQLGE